MYYLKIYPPTGKNGSHSELPLESEQMTYDEARNYKLELEGDGAKVFIFEVDAKYLKKQEQLEKEAEDFFKEHCETRSTST